MATLTSRHRKLLAEHGLKGTYVESTDIESEDSEIQLAYAPSGLPTGYSVQISLYGGYYVNQHGGEGDDLWLKTCGEFRALLPALKHAARLAYLGRDRSRDGPAAQRAKVVRWSGADQLESGAKPCISAL